MKKYLRRFIILLIATVLLINNNVYANEETLIDKAMTSTEVGIKYASSKTKKKTITGCIYIGDSRFVGMNDVCGIEDSKKTFVIAEIGKGYKWFESNALPKMKEIKKNNKSINNWKIVIGLGVNDLYNVNRYIKKYKSMAKKNNIIIVSVNPIEYHKSLSNADITKFNSKIKEIKGIKYIDTYNYLISNGYKTTDGLHYDNNTYKKVYKKVKLSIKKSKKQKTK